MNIDNSVTITEPQNPSTTRSFSEPTYTINGMAGKYLLATQNDNGDWMIATAYVSATSTYLEASIRETTDGKFTESTEGEFDNYIFTVTRKEAAGDDMYTIMFQNKYIASTGQTGNGVKLYDAERTDNSTTFRIIYSSKWNIIAQNSSSSSVYLRRPSLYETRLQFMASTLGKDTYLFKLEE